MQTTLAQFNETQSQDAFALQNSKLLKVRLGASGDIQAKAGSMVAYQGEVSFEHAGSGGIGRMMKKAMTGEGTTLMKMAGSGEVFLADQAQDIHLIYLENDFITVNGPNLLAFDADIEWDIKRVQGGASGAMAGGLYNMELRGTGWVAILSDGPPVLLNVASAADVRRRPGRDHVVVGRDDVAPHRLQDEEPDRQRSGETIQLAFGGQGWVLVQPSEGRVAAATGSSSSGGLGGLLGGSRPARPQTWTTSPVVGGVVHGPARSRGTTSAPRAACRTRRGAAAPRRRRARAPVGEQPQRARQLAPATPSARRRSAAGAPSRAARRPAPARRAASAGR